VDVGIGNRVRLPSPPDFAPADAGRLRLARQTPITEQFRRTFFSQGRSLPDIVPSPSRDDVGHSFQESARSAAACCVPQRLLDKLALTRAQEMLGPYFCPDWQTAQSQDLLNKERAKRQLGSFMETLGPTAEYEAHSARSSTEVGRGKRGVTGLLGV